MILKQKNFNVTYYHLWHKDVSISTIMNLWRNAPLKVSHYIIDDTHTQSYKWNDERINSKKTTTTWRRTTAKVVVASKCQLKHAPYPSINGISLRLIVIKFYALFMCMNENAKPKKYVWCAFTCNVLLYTSFDRYISLKRPKIICRHFNVRVFSDDFGVLRCARNWLLLLLRISAFHNLLFVLRMHTITKIGHLSPCCWDFIAITFGALKTAQAHTLRYQPEPDTIDRNFLLSSLFFLSKEPLAKS